jgi:hypothetical protein
MCKPGAQLYAVSRAPNPVHSDVVVIWAREETGILPEYENLNEISSKTKARTVAEHGLYDLTINLVEGKKPS